MYEDHGLVMRDLHMGAYLLSAITLHDEDNPKGYTETYTTDEKGQSEAFETLKDIFKEYDVITPMRKNSEKEKGNKLPGLVGPKRLEVVLRKLGQPGVERRVVVTDLMSPAQHFSSYSVSGRTWEVYQKKLRRLPIETTWSSSHWLARIDTYIGGLMGSSVEHFTQSTQKDAWAMLERLWAKFKPAEILVVKNWDVNVDSDDDEFADAWQYGGYAGGAGGGEHWTNRTPPYYDITPKVAHYRVSGDEVGAVLYREQVKVWEEEGSPTPEQSLKEVLEAKEKTSAEKKISTTKSSTTKGSSNGVCNGCGAVGCDAVECIDADALGGTLIDGTYTVH